MENTLHSTHHRKFLVMPAIFSIVYTFGVFGFVFLWLGMQYLPGFAGFEKYGLLFSILCLLGAVSNFAIMRGHRWGVIGQVCTWIANFYINILLHREVEQYLGIAIFFIVLWGFDVHRNRRLLN